MIIPMRGEIELQVQIAGTDVTHKFVVCDKLMSEDILAGNDLLRKLEARIDFREKIIFTRGGQENFLNRPEN